MVIMQAHSAGRALSSRRSLFRQRGFKLRPGRGGPSPLPLRRKSSRRCSGPQHMESDAPKSPRRVAEKELDAASLAESEADIIPTPLEGEVWEERGDSTRLSTPADIAVSSSELGAADAESEPISDFIHSDAQYTELGSAPRGAVNLNVPLETFEILEGESGIIIDLGMGKEDAATRSAIKEDAAAEEEGEVGGNLFSGTLLLRSPTSLTLKQVLGFAVPAFAAILTDPLMSFIDTACVGKVSSQQLAALGPNTAIFGFILQVCTAICTYTCGTVSKLAAVGDHDKVRKLVMDGMVLATVLGTAFAAAMCSFPGQLLSSFGVQAELAGYAATYLKIRALSLPFVLVCMVGGSTCLGLKDSKTPMIVSAVAAMLNLFGDIFLIYGPPQMGIAGAAWATTASCVAAAGYYTWELNKRYPLIGMPLPKVKDLVPFVSASSILTVRNIAIMANYLIMAMSAAAMGTVTSAAHQVGVSLFMVGGLSAEPLSQCAQSFLASIASSRRRRYDEQEFLRNSAGLLLKATIVVGVTMGVAITGACLLPGLFTNDTLVAAEVLKVGPIIGLAVLGSCWVCITDGLILASRDFKFAAVASLANVPIVAFSIAAGTRMGLGIQGIWFGLLFFYAARIIENGLRFKQLNRQRLEMFQGHATKTKFM